MSLPRAPPLATQDSVGALTQCSQGGKVKMSIDKFVNALVEKYNEIEESSAENVDPSLVHKVQAYFTQLLNEARINRVLSYISSSVSKNQGRTCATFTVTWFGLLKHVRDDAERETLKLHVLKALISILGVPRVSEDFPWDLYRACDVFVQQLSSCCPRSLKDLLESATDNILTADDFSPLWIESTAGLLKIIGALDDESALHRHLIRWLTKARTPETFSKVLELIRCPKLHLDVTSILDTFINEILTEQMPEDKENMSWKAVLLLDCVDAKMNNQILRTLMLAWPGNNTIPSTEILPAIRQLGEMLKFGGESVGEAFLGFFKREHGIFLSSEFGFLAGIAWSERDFGKDSFIPELRRVLGKLFGFEDELEQNGWIQTTEFNDLLRVVVNQFEHTLARLEEGECWDLFGEQMVRLSFSLFQLPCTTPVVVVDGRATDGPRPWTIAQTAIRRIMVAVPSSIEKVLPELLQWIMRYGNSKTGASMMLIDILFDVVKNQFMHIMSQTDIFFDVFHRICEIGQACALPLVRCLVPVINHRAQLRAALLKGLQRGIYCPLTAKSAVPILLVLLRSVSKRVNVRAHDDTGHSMSQSFASFSTQSLALMGLKRANDETVGLAVIEIMKNCLNVLAPTRSVLYQSIAEAAARCEALIIPSLDLLVGHITKVPAWNVDGMTESDDTRTELNEALPQYVQALESLLCDLVPLMQKKEQEQPSKEDLKNLELFNSGNSILQEWVDKAVSADVHDLGIDKLADMNPANRTGRANLLFANMIVNMYDGLLEHVWNRFSVYQSKDYCDSLMSLLRRRTEVSEILEEKLLRRKEVKAAANDAPKVDIESTQIFIRTRTIRGILERLCPVDADPGYLDDFKTELLSWSLNRIYDLSESLLKTNHPLHSIIADANDLIPVARILMGFYSGADCAPWLQEMEQEDPRKTRAIESYANILCYLCKKYRCTPEKIVRVWKDADTSRVTQRREVNKDLFNQIRLLMTKIFPEIMPPAAEDERAGRRLRREKQIMCSVEKQSKALIKTAWSILQVISSKNANSVAFQLMLRMMSTTTFENTVVLRDLLKFVDKVGLRCSDNENIVTLMLEMAEDVLTILSDEEDPPKHAFINEGSQSEISEFLFSNLEGQLRSIKNAVNVLREIFPKDKSLDRLLCDLFVKCDQCATLLSRILPQHTQFGVHRERIAKLLTNCFTGLQSPVDLLLSERKNVPEMVEWQCIEVLGSLLKGKLANVIAMADERVGLLDPNQDEGLSERQKVAKSTKEKRIYVKYVRARESFQCKVLQLCKVLQNDDRLNLIIKNNSIGLRDFRLYVAKLTEPRVEEPSRKKKKADRDTDAGDQPDPDEEGADVAEEPMDEEEQEEEGADEDPEGRSSRRSIVY